MNASSNKAPIGKHGMKQNMNAKKNRRVTQKKAENPQENMKIEYSDPLV